VIWTLHSATSDWVISEAAHAARQKKLIPLRARDLDTWRIPKPYDARHTDVFDDFAAVLRAVRRVVGRGTDEAAALRQAEEDRRRKEEAAAFWRAKEEHRRNENAEALRRTVEERRRKEEKEALRRAEDERTRKEAEALKRAEESRQREDEARARHLAEEERKRKEEAEALKQAQERSEMLAKINEAKNEAPEPDGTWRRLAGVGGSVFALLFLGFATVWLSRPSTPSAPPPQPQSAQAARSPYSDQSAQDAIDCEKLVGDNAIAACTRVIASPRFGTYSLYHAYFNRAYEYGEKRDYEHALADYGEAIRLEPQAIVYHKRGDIYREIRDYERAIADYDAAIRLDPADAKACRDRGLAKRAKGDFAAANADTEKAGRLDPRVVRE
jgi:tetratricopeptide (TPR) repeat protein